MSSKSTASVRRSIKYVESMSYEDVVRYAGQWLAVVDEEIAAHGEYPARVHRDGCNAGKGDPYMHYVYASPSEVPFLFYVP